LRPLTSPEGSTVPDPAKIGGSQPRSCCASRRCYPVAMVHDPVVAVQVPLVRSLALALNETTSVRHPSRIANRREQEPEAYWLATGVLERAHPNSMRICPDKLKAAAAVLAWLDEYHTGWRDPSTQGEVGIPRDLWADLTGNP